MPWSLAVGAGAGLLSALHCSAMCGPLAAAQSARRTGRVAPHLRYQLGRAIGYGLIGGLAGASGNAVIASGSPLVGAIFSWSLAAGLLLLAARMWRTERAASSTAPVPIGRRRRPVIARLVAALRPGPLGMGVLTALLPCGALWAALGLAAASGAALTGTLLMIGFAGGTSIGLIASGWLGGLLRRRSAAGRRALAVVLVAGAVVAAMRPIEALQAGTGEPPCHRSAPGAS